MCVCGNSSPPIFHVSLSPSLFPPTHGSENSMAEARISKHEDSNDCILETLSLPESPVTASDPSDGLFLPCMFCEQSYKEMEKDGLLKHMIIEHKLVIADVKLIANFRRYVGYWKKRFADQAITDFCSVIKTNSEAPEDQQENYFLLCDVLPEDRALREDLQQERLKNILEQQQHERSDTSFRRLCMFCSEEFEGNRSILFNHMNEEHSFNVGLPDNLVYCNEFLDTLQKKMENLQCLYCEKSFRDKNTLKDHMRKKQHRKINAQNHEYDQFYIINYLELGKSWEEVQSEDDHELRDNNEQDWSDWEEHPVSAVCLFCDKQADTTEKLLCHMKENHQFDLHKIKTDLGLNFYQQVKLVNFIRRQIYQCRCHGCQEKFQSKTELITHMEEEKHLGVLPERSLWDQPQYYFPTYENDSLLCTLSDSEEELSAQDQDKEIPIIGEDLSSLEALKQASILNQLIHDRGFRS
ncbi:zinc finger protein 277 [Mixophyes fleayi]|uniref:zinc finger protein 277 n=1 Tax=Mixophyes fleayi TaxID=3061075 RepID=UPI003F4D9C34